MGRLSPITTKCCSLLIIYHWSLSSQMILIETKDVLIITHFVITIHRPWPSSNQEMINPNTIIYVVLWFLDLRLDTSETIYNIHISLPTDFKVYNDPNIHPSKTHTIPYIIVISKHTHIHWIFLKSKIPPRSENGSKNIS